MTLIFSVQRVKCENNYYIIFEMLTFSLKKKKIYFLISVNGAKQ